MSDSGRGDATFSMKSRSSIASVLYVILALLFVGLIVFEFRRAAKARRVSSAVMGSGAVV